MLLRRFRFKLAAIAAAAMVAAAPAAAGTAAPGCVPGGPWTQTGNQALDHGMSVGSAGAGWSNMTLRQEVTISAGGSQLRLHLSDEFAADPVTFGHVSVAQQLNGAASVAAPVVVTFGGATSVTLAAGAETVSDAVSFPTTPGERLLVSLFLPPTDNIPTANAHSYGNATEYNIVGQDATTEVSPQVTNTYGFVSYLNGVDVDAASAQTVVAIGDSITDTGDTPVDADNRWPNYLARRTSLAVIDQGISGNQVLQDLGSAGGPSLQHRWQHDVLGIPGVRTVIIAEGINDLRAGATATSLESALAALVASGHTAGLKVFLATITPCTGASSCTTAEEQQRQALNTWVRSGASGADATADFDAAVGAGPALAAMYDGGSHIHPNSAGELSMAGVIDISKL